MRTFTVTGMSCAACSARVEKSVCAVPGVTSCAVNLLTNSMGVEGEASTEAIVKAVEVAGYGAHSVEAASTAPSGTSGKTDLLEDTETPRLRLRLI